LPEELGFGGKSSGELRLKAEVVFEPVVHSSSLCSLVLGTGLPVSITKYLGKA